MAPADRCGPGQGEARVLGLFRIVVAGLFASHGVASLFGVLGRDAVPVRTWPYGWAALIELVGGVLVALGLFLRPAALLCSGAMAFAYFTEHQPRGLLPLQNDGEPAALFCWSFLVLATLAPRALSLLPHR
ncbi:hypothetical protein GCM10010329_77400 [Streptomyces spiroverticillatus]|uniref:DoxX family membrane protein n=1 Tax=Streptomyces finlayi TaxID=67296 RepID=A0A919CE40_9ACTN|nr:DoxX family protein [Streptomyces finlayi]GHA42992.1 hypothetical protein GCM10010329_77400 [Streptomyces spiroverticillatus]GHD13976.1 hypothetical protein GCM10010334_72810 [Streptomyces finlayi]